MIINGEDFVNQLRKVANSLDVTGMDRRERAEVAARAFLSVIDKGLGDVPPIAIIPCPDPDDKEYHIENEENYYPVDTPINPTGVSLLDCFDNLTHIDCDQDAPRPYTEEEMRYAFLRHIKNMVAYWAEEVRAPTDELVHSVMFSILSAIDGSSMDVPLCDLSDGEYIINDDIFLHEIWHQ